MKEDVTSFVRDCDQCCRVNLGPVKNAPPLNSISVPSKVWSLVGIDIVGPLPITDTSNKYIVAATDHFSKWSEARAIGEKTAENVGKFILDCVCRLGPMDSIITDQGKEFTNKVVDFLTDELQIDHRISSAYHPQTNGQRERDNRTLKEMLSKVTNENATDWDVLLQSALFAYRTSIHSSTKCTPFEVMYGRKARIVPNSGKKPTLESCKFADSVLTNIADQRKEINECVKNNIETAQERQKKNYDRRHQSHSSYPVGSSVLMKNTSKIRRFGCKLAPRWVGPYRVIETLDKGRVRLQNAKSKKTLSNIYHSTHLKLYTPDTQTSHCQTPTSTPKRTLKTTKSAPLTPKQTRKQTKTTSQRQSQQHHVNITKETPAKCIFKTLPASALPKLCNRMNIKFLKCPNYGNDKESAGKPSEIHSIRGDGNCLFRAISFALSGTENGHKSCRDSIVAHMRNSSVTTKLSKYLDTNVNEYLEESNMDCNSVWATDAEILGAASLLDTDICVFSKCGTDSRGVTKFNWLRYPASLSLDKKSKYAIYLNNLTNEHFNVVLRC